MKKLTDEVFINRSNEIHKNFYNYSLVKYTNSRTKVEIICPMHGIFKQRPLDHIKGCGCFQCFGSIKYTNDTFINKANIVHKNKYDYSLVEYKNSYTKVKIVCPIHGVFEQKPNDHLNNHGCPSCKSLSISKKLSHNTDIFIEKIKNKNFYDYSLVDYINGYTKIKIICPKHGIFEQTPNDHLAGNGCPICKMSKGELKIKQFLEEKNINYIPQHGFSECKNKNILKFDFYLPKLNICIEYDGEQHFKKIIGWGGDKTLEMVQHNDLIKQNYCKSNKIKLIRIPYWYNQKEVLEVLENLT